MQKRIRKPENNVQKVYRYTFSATVTWFLFSLLPSPALPWNFQHFGFWGWLLIYSAGLALVDVITGAIADIYRGVKRTMRAEEPPPGDEAQAI